MFALGTVLHLLKGPHLVAGRRRGGDAGGAGRQPTLLPGAVRPAVAAAAGPVRPDLPGCRLRVRRGQPVPRAGPGRARAHRLGRRLDDLRAASSASTAPYTYDGRFFADMFPAALLALGIVGLVGLLLAAVPAARRPATRTGRDDWERAEALVPHLRLGHPRVLRPARRQELLLLLRRRGDDRLHLHGRVRAGVGRPDRRSRLAADRGRRVPRDVRRARVEPRVPGRARGGRARLRRPRVPPLLPGRRGDHRLRHLRARGAGEKSVRAAVRRVGKSYRFQLVPESKASPTLVRQLNEISARWRGKKPERGFTMSLQQDVAGTDPEFLLCVAFDEHDRPGGFLRHRARLRRRLRLHARPDAPRPRRAERDDRVPHRRHAPRR